MAPMCDGRAGAADVGADVRGEVAAGARVHGHVERHRHRERPHRVGLRLLLVGHGEHLAVHAGLDQRGGHDRGGAADRAGGVHAQQRLARGAERLGEEELGHHHALEQVGGLADDDRVDLVEGQAGVLERPVHRLAAQAGHRDVLALRAVVGLADADDGGGLLAHRAPPGVEPVETPSCTRGSAAAPARRSRAPACGTPRPTRSGSRPRRRGCHRRRTSGCSPAHLPTG